MHSELVIVDDNGTEHDITNAVSEVTIRRTQDGSCTAAIGMPWVMVMAEAHGVELDERTRDALLSLGWTSPAMTSDEEMHREALWNNGPYNPDDGVATSSNEV